MPQPHRGGGAVCSSSGVRRGGWECVCVVCVGMGGGLFCTNQAFCVCKSKQRCNNNNIRAEAASTAICQILMSGVKEPRDK